MIKREGYTKRMERKLDAWRRRFETRRSEAATRGAGVTSNTREELEAAKVAGDAATAKLSELRAAAGRYGELRDEMDALWKAIDDTPPEEPVVVDTAAPPAPRAKRASTA